VYNIQLDAAYRVDFIVENCVIVEIKAVEKLLPKG
jgi:GxxExxY protein